MSKPKVYVTRELPQKALEMIAKECEMEINPHDRALTRGELEEAVQGIDGLLCLLTDNIDGDL
ncbi:MAG: D-glycerate dehydrogenase, partial [bacterium]